MSPVTAGCVVECIDFQIFYFASNLGRGYNGRKSNQFDVKLEDPNETLTHTGCCEWIGLGWFTCTIESSAQSWVIKPNKQSVVGQFSEEDELSNGETGKTALVEW
ncbi:unnamed protein product [Brugia pahangi]|uniref:PLAT domain-containing protein n=1 Tax=Brugia pahangi TaxID=6280 RepID=A0A0N4T9E7_BRUPA|nr:unnamed protein product [Brugia pahangi]